jgi:hypothetical protein
MCYLARDPVAWLRRYEMACTTVHCRVKTRIQFHLIHGLEPTLGMVVSRDAQSVLLRADWANIACQSITPLCFIHCGEGIEQYVNNKATRRSEP